MKIATLALSRQGALVAEKLCIALPASMHLHEDVPGWPETERFEKIATRTEELFPDVRGLIFVCPIGVVVRSIAPLLRHKLSDPAVVAVDIGGRWAVSLLSGHEGGANELAVRAAGIIGAEPVVTTATDAARDIIAGVGCRKGIAKEAVVAAVDEALAQAGVARERLRLLASADIKRNETGLLDAAIELERPLLFIDSEVIRSYAGPFAVTPAAQRQVDLPAVAEPCALLAGRRTTLILPKLVQSGVTVALARENCSSLA